MAILVKFIKPMNAAKVFNKKELDLTNNMAIIPFSSVTKLGKEQVLNEIEKVLED